MAVLGLILGSQAGDYLGHHSQFGTGRLLGTGARRTFPAAPLWRSESTVPRSETVVLIVTSRGDQRHSDHRSGSRLRDPGHHRLEPGRMAGVPLGTETCAAGHRHHAVTRVACVG